MHAELNRKNSQAFGAKELSGNREGGAQPLETLLKTAAESPAAASDIACRLLVGRDAPHLPADGMALLERAALQNEPGALCTLATLRAAGAWTHQSWPEALDLLQRAAIAGSADARAQICLIASDRALARAACEAGTDSDVWRRLCQSIDLHAFVAPPPPVQVLQSPRAWTVTDFATPELCAWLIGRSAGKLKPAKMRDATTGIASALDTRTCSDFVFDIVQGGIVMLLLRTKISAAVSIPVPHMEPPQIFHYAVGQEIKAHFDFVFDGKHPYGQDGTYTGDRLVTFLLYLNDGYDGGELEFPKAGYRYKGRIGDGIFFASQREGKPDRMSLHAGRPVTRGEKYVLSQWIHNQPFRA